VKKAKLEKNVNEFIDKCSEDMGKWKAEDFNQSMWCECTEGKIQSPIEQILYCALKYIQTLNSIDDYDDRYNFISKKPYSTGLWIKPQAVIDKYRCDFSLFYVEISREPVILIVECDSQEFHERTEKERRYEKARDRYFTMQGYKIFHYTGSEIVKRPLEIAGEILAYITDTDIKEMLLDSNIEN